MNLFSFTGNLGKDCEVKTLQSGSTVCEFSVAVKSGYGDREKTNWVKCAMFGKKAEGQLPQYLRKGTQVAISGELELQEWESQNGKGSTLAVSVQNLDLIGSKPEDQQQSQASPQQTYQQPTQAAPQQAAPQHTYQQAQQSVQQQAPQQQANTNPNQNANGTQQSPMAQNGQPVQNQNDYDPNEIPFNQA